jgi:vacuolar-type H+-ATPase subunit E/Vma4
MDGQQAGMILENMIKFIEQSGNERVADIKQQGKQDFAVQKEQAIETKKKMLTESYKNKLDNEEVKLKI